MNTQDAVQRAYGRAGDYSVQDLNDRLVYSVLVPKSRREQVINLIAPAGDYSVSEKGDKLLFKTEVRKRSGASFVDKEAVAKELIGMARELSGTSRKMKAADFPYAFVTVFRDGVMFLIAVSDDSSASRGTEPYGDDPIAAIEKVCRLVRKYKVPPGNVEIRV